MRPSHCIGSLAAGGTIGLVRHGDRIRIDLNTRKVDVLLPDGTNVNHKLVKDGWCWWYRKYAPGDTELERLEQDARRAKRGLWADSNPVPPWEWRNGR